MDARRTSVGHPRNEVDTWLRTCDICVHQATNPVTATCGHLFCSSCLDDAFVHELLRRNACPICNDELSEQTADNFSVVEPAASAGPTRARRPIVSEAAASAVNNITMTGPVAAAGMEVVQDMVDEESLERTTIMQELDLIRISTDWMAQRIQNLEEALERMVQMNVDLFREMQNRNEVNRGLRRRIAQLENLSARASNVGLGMNSVLHRNFVRRIPPTPIATHAFVNVTEEQPIPVRESVEGGSSSMNPQAGV